MGKIFSNGIPVATGLKIVNNSPSDDSQYLEFYSDLNSLEYKHDGKICYIKEQNFKAYIYRIESNSWQPYSDATTGPVNALVSSGKVTQVGNVYTYEANDAGVNFQWNIGGVPFVNVSSEITIPLAASSNHRIDITYVDASNGIKRRAGVEVLTSQQAVAPALLPNEILLNTIFVTNTTVSAPEPVDTDLFVRKGYQKPVFELITSNVIDISKVTDGQTNFVITQPNSVLHGFDNIYTGAEYARFYSGKPIIIDNQSGTNLTLSHLGANGQAKFQFSNNAALIMPNNERVFLEFVYAVDSESNFVKLVAKSWQFPLDIIPYTATSDFNPLPAWRGQVVEIDLGGVNRTMTINASAFFAIIFKGSGVLTVLSGAGRTLVEQNNSNEITENATTSLIFSIGTTDYLSIKDLAIIAPQDYALNEFNNPTVNPFLRLNNILPQGDTVTGNSSATTFAVTLEPYVDDNYKINFTLNHDNRVWYSDKTLSGFTINTANVMNGSQTVEWSTVKYS